MDKRKVTVILFPGEDGGYVAFMPLFPSCTTEGDTVEETLKNAKESLELALEVRADTDLESLNYSHAKYVTVGRWRWKSQAMFLLPPQGIDNIDLLPTKSRTFVKSGFFCCPLTVE